MVIKERLQAERDEEKEQKPENSAEFILVTILAFDNCLTPRTLARAENKRSFFAFPINIRSEKQDIMIEEMMPAHSETGPRGGGYESFFLSGLFRLGAGLSQAKVASNMCVACTYLDETVII